MGEMLAGPDGRPRSRMFPPRGRMQQQADELTGKAFEAAESFKSSLWSWGQDLLGSSGLDSDCQAVHEPVRESSISSGRSSSLIDADARAHLPVPNSKSKRQFMKELAKAAPAVPEAAG